VPMTVQGQEWSMSSVNYEEWLSAVRTEEYRVIEDEIRKRLHSDLKCQFLS
jgi:hypothetical protein